MFCRGSHTNLAECGPSSVLQVPVAWSVNGRGVLSSQSGTQCNTMSGAEQCSVEPLLHTGRGIRSLHGMTSLWDYNVQFSAASGMYPVLGSSESPRIPPAYGLPAGAA